MSVLSNNDFDSILSEFRGAVERSISNSRDIAWLEGILNMISSRMYMMTMRQDILIQAELFKGSSILDFGTGSGICAFFLSKIGFNVTGIDITEFQNDLSSHATMKYEQELLWSELLKVSPLLSLVHYSGSVPFVDNYFSDTVAYAVLEHIPDSELSFSINEIKRVMRSDGTLFVSRLPRKYSYAEWLSKLFRIGHHDKLYSKNEILSLMNDCGFQVIFYEENDMFPSYPSTITNAIFPILSQIENIFLKTPLRKFSHHQRFSCTRVIVNE